MAYLLHIAAHLAPVVCQDSLGHPLVSNTVQDVLVYGHLGLADSQVFNSQNFWQKLEDIGCYRFIKLLELLRTRGEGINAVKQKSPESSKCN